MSAIRELLAAPLPLKHIVLPNRIIRSATYEGMADEKGYPTQQLGDLYVKIVQDAPCTLITGFCAVSAEGKAMHPRQGAILDDSYIQAWRAIIEQVKAAQPAAKLFMQIAHTGRQTKKMRTRLPVVGASARACSYFKEPVNALSEQDILRIIQDFALAAHRAQQAGFDGVQIHAAHGYLIHQFISPHTNTRMDKWQDPGLFLQHVVMGIRKLCGQNFPILIKVSHADDRGLTSELVSTVLSRVEQDLDAVEVSYGTMEYALNIIRGDCPIDTLFKVNPLFSHTPRVLQWLWKLCVYPWKKREFVAFTRHYNLDGALSLKKEVSIPVIAVGGLGSLEDMALCLENGCSAVALCRPFVCQPNVAARIFEGKWSHSPCTRCNLCTIYCDSNIPLRCYQVRIA